MWEAYGEGTEYSSYLRVSPIPPASPHTHLRAGRREGNRSRTWKERVTWSKFFRKEPESKYFSLCRLLPPADGSQGLVQTSLLQKKERKWRRIDFRGICSSSFCIWELSGQHVVIDATGPTVVSCYLLLMACYQYFGNKRMNFASDIFFGSLKTKYSG